MKDSIYQSKINEVYDNTNKNIFINASAGSGKSHTLRQLCKRTPPNKRICFLAFNKSIKDEAEMKFPPKVDISTSHSKGYKILRDNVNMNVTLNENKNFIYCKNVLKDKKFPNQRKRNAYFFIISDIINFIKLNLAPHTEEGINGVCQKFGISVSPEQIKDTIKVLKEIESWEKNLNGKKPKFINYTDMLYLAVTKVKPENFPKYDVVMVDECFPYNQYIATGDDSKRKIGSIVRKFHKGEAQYVKSYNESKNCFELKKVINAWNKGERDLLKLKLGGKRDLLCTHNHKLLTNKGWKYVEYINKGDFLMSSNREQPYHSFLNTDQTDIFIASTIGDGGLQNLDININRVRFIHGEKQKDYLYWKANIFNSEDLIVKIEENGYSKKPAYTFVTKGYCIDNYLVNKENIINNLNLKQLSVLYMDDGSLQKKISKLYTLVSDEILINKLSNKIKELGFDNKVFKSKSSSSGKPYWYISFSTHSSFLLSQAIAPYIHKNLSYKVLDEFKDNCGDYVWDNQQPLLGGMVVTDKIYNFKKEEVFDIEVEDNHNFIACSKSMNKNIKTRFEGFIAHNCQDFNVAQQKLTLNLLKPNGRLIAVGDEKQNIYGFIGASLDTFNFFKNRPNTESLTLPMTYRCGKKIVDLANTIFPEGTIPFEENKDGEIRKGEVIEATDGDLIICRNNKPLIKAWIKLAAQKQKSYIIGKDFGFALKGILFGLKHIMDIQVVLSDKITELTDLGITNPTSNKSYQALKEKCDIIELLYEEIGDLREVTKVIDSIFQKDETGKGVRMSTIHKAKGLEAERCFILNWGLLPSEYATTESELYGERCLQYVAITRAKSELVFTEIDV